MRIFLQFLLIAFPILSICLAQDTLRLDLSGLGKDDAVPWEFMCTEGRRAGQWTTIPVPSNWEMHGFGTLNYGRDDTSRPVEQGRYRRRFHIPVEWKGLRVFLVFDGVMTDTEVSINGKLAGPRHQGGFYRFSYEVTNLLEYGTENLLEVTVDKLSSDLSVNRAERQGDYWVFGGIYRPVYLQAVPQQFLEHVAIDARVDGTFIIQVDVNGTGPDTVEAQVTDLSGRPIGNAFFARIESGRAVLRATLPAIRPWSAETPNLYLVQTRLKQADRLVHQRQDRFGFRTFQVKTGDGLYLNGARVILKGVNRHCFWPDTGRCLSEAVDRMDVELIRQMNMNAVRMSHYPPDERFLDLCDEVGLYVLDELAGWQKAYETQVGRSLVREMVLRDRNHPCILFWDNGNEGGWNTELDSEFGRWDIQQRPVLHPLAIYSAVNTDHYETYESTKKLCSSGDILMPTEFLHGLFDGGAGAGLEDYWSLMLSSKTIGGGFIWAFVDEGLRRPDTGLIDVAGNAAPDGILGPYRQKEASFFAIKQIWCPIFVCEKTLPDGFDGKLTIENRYSFTNTAQCRFIAELRSLPTIRPIGFGDNNRAVICKTEVPAIPPGQKGQLRIELPAGWQGYDCLALRARDPAGMELWTWTWPLPGVERFCRITSRPGAMPIKVTETQEDIDIQVGRLNLRFARADARLLSVRLGEGAISLSNGPRLLSGEGRLVHMEHSPDGQDYLVKADYEGQFRSVIWRIQANGWICCDYEYAAQGPQEVLGIGFDYPQHKVRAKTWIGDGPYPVWKNRLAGVTFGLWSNRYNDTITGWSGWDYPPFKGYFSNVRWLQLDTDEGPITAVLKLPMFVQVLTPSLPPANLRMKTDLPIPEAGLAFLHAIPAIGNKFHTAAQTGPQGQPTMADGLYRGSVYFFFGPLDL